MTRSFTERVLGGVCGGLGTAFRINPWLLRVVFIILGGVSFPAGTMAVIAAYVLLWWIMPQGSPIGGRGGGFFGFLLILLAIFAVGAAWAGWRMGWLSTTTASGDELYYPILLLLLSLGYLVRQIRA